MEEKTEAMASQFSSLDIVDDIFSKLPEHIIHNILSSLPSIKDVVRTSVISKSGLQAWRTYPIPEFNIFDFVSREEGVDEAKTEQFIRFVDTSIQRFGNGNTMKIFNLCSNVNEQMAHHITRWIGIALDNKVEHLALDMYFKKDGSLQFPGLMPDRVLSAYWLKSLKLSGPVDLPKSLTEGNRIDLPELTSLHIDSSYVSDEQLQKLLSGCPALEYIGLDECVSLSKVDIFNHPNLETLKVTVGDISIRVSAPKLKSFDYSFDDFRGDVKIYNSPELKSLTIRDPEMTDERFHTFIAQFPLMENLTIDCCDALRNIRVTNPRLEKISITNCSNLKDVVISSKKFASFSLSTDPSSIPKLSIPMEMDNPPNDCTTQIFDPLGSDVLMEASFFSFFAHHLMEASWYCKLKDFLSGPFIFKSLNIVVPLTIPWSAALCKEGDMKGEDVHKKLPPAACNIEKLKLMVKAPSSCHAHILNGLLSACHPTTIVLGDHSDKHFVKLVCEELGDRESNKCCCKDDFKCWKHQLKEVKIEKIKGIKLEKDLDWDALFDLLPTLEDGNNIYFKLMW